jgi:hypothetical protein
VRRPTEADLIRDALHAPFEHGTVYVTHFTVYETDFGYDSPRIIVDAHLTKPLGGKEIWDHDDIHAMYAYVRELADELGIEQIVTPAVAMSSPAPTS